MASREDTLLTEARKALNINVPIYRFTIKGNTVTFWLYGRTKSLKYTRPRKRTKKASA